MVDFISKFADFCAGAVKFLLGCVVFAIAVATFPAAFLVEFYYMVAGMFVRSFYTRKDDLKEKYRSNFVCMSGFHAALGIFKWAFSDIEIHRGYADFMIQFEGDGFHIGEYRIYLFWLPIITALGAGVIYWTVKLIMFPPRAEPERIGLIVAAWFAIIFVGPFLYTSIFRRAPKAES